jgi:hypothetical protein
MRFINNDTSLTCLALSEDDHWLVTDARPHNILKIWDLTLVRHTGC